MTHPHSVFQHHTEDSDVTGSAVAMATRTSRGQRDPGGFLKEADNIAPAMEAKLKRKMEKGKKFSKKKDTIQT